MADIYHSLDNHLARNPSVATENLKNRQKNNFIADNFDNQKSDMYFSQEIDIEVPLYPKSKRSFNYSLNRKHCEI